jgi:hypothetical protein
VQGKRGTEVLNIAATWWSFYLSFLLVDHWFFLLSGLMTKEQLSTGLLAFGGFLFSFGLNRLYVFGCRLFSKLYLSAWLPPFNFSHFCFGSFHSQRLAIIGGKPHSFSHT